MSQIRLKKRFIAAVLAIIIPQVLSALGHETLATPSGLNLEMAFRVLGPGEPLIFILKNQPGITAVTVRFLGKRLVLKPSRIGRSSFAFLGIDLDIKPGSYPLDAHFERKKGSVEVIHRDIAILPRDFSSARLWVKKEMATPPKSAAERIRRESEIIRIVFSLNTPEWLGDGAFIAPHPAESWSNFGQRRITNNVLRTVHGGVDIMAPPDDPIRSVNRGRVVLAADFFLSGKTVIIDHGLGVFSFYCHLARLLVKRGEVVIKGQVIGRCGSTGRSTGPHLHWAMLIGESRVDPYAMVLLPISVF